ncbi:MAG TPA: cupin domain-containing protein [Solirubrobacteraceae bacterium]
MLKANVFSDACEYEDSDPTGYHSAALHLTKRLGGKGLAVKLFELPPGQSLCPYHYEYEEEWLVVLEGSVLLRTPEGEETLERGAAVCFATGPAGAHKVGNAGTQTARVMMFSSAREPAVAVYPDSDKIGVWPGEDRDKVMLRRKDGGVDYWDGES